MNQAFCILAAGRGSRLGDLTASVNKALLPVDNKAAITHIIEKVPQDCEIVIAVGYDKEKLQEYCLAAHPERTFVFVEVDRLEGPGSGPGYSLLRCKKHLQRPFYLCNVDTLIAEDEYLPLDQNWIGCAPTNDTQKYATVDLVLDGLSWRVARFYDKGLTGGNEAYIGIMGIRDFDLYWGCLELATGVQAEQQYIAPFMDGGCCLEYLKPLAVQYDWFDTGSVEGYQATCGWFEGGEILGLPKNISEITYRVGDRLIKLCLDSRKNAARLARAELLADLIPEIVFRGRYVMAYNWVHGKPLYAFGCNPDLWLAFLNRCEVDLWYHAPTPDRWGEICHGFYRDKTWERMSQYLVSRGMDHGTGSSINGYFCHPPEAYLTGLDWDDLCDGIPVPFHGDLQFDNVISGNDGRFYLIDWRECFGDSLMFGDLYYDLAKIYSGLDVPYDRLKREEFSFAKEGEHVDYSFYLTSELVAFRDIYEGWLRKKGYDVQKVKTLAALIYINMSPLHPGRIGDLLFYHGIFRLALLSDWSAP